MRPLLFAGIAAGLLAAGAGVALAAGPPRKRVTAVPFQAMFEAAGTRHGVDWRLIAAHAYAESSFIPLAYNAEGSSGLMQILMPLARNTGVMRHYNAGNLPEFDNVDERELFDPAYNINLGAALIRENIKVYGLPRAIAVYNMDRARQAPIAGPFANQSYVDKVITKARALGMKI